MKIVRDYLISQQFHKVYYDEPLSKHTTFRVGGKAKILVIPDEKQKLIELISFLKDEKIPFRIFGNGSNILPSDKDYDGVIIKPQLALNNMEVNGDTVTVDAGYSLVRLAYDMIKYELTGLEFLGGIPGTIGGACFMNAGAYNREMKDCLVQVEYLDKNGKLVTSDVNNLQFAYRSSIFQKERPLLILKASLKLSKGDGKEIKELLEKRRARRLLTQPLEYPSAGSTFRNPEGTHAYLLIDQAGLRGKKIGGAMISEKHCNFIINVGGATSRDIRDLIELVIDVVFKATGVTLIPEIEFFNW
ncbi:MAG: UDP-N-acetylmuramate dehydrogenase [Bacilli bacterium]|nr:UDP-N-acetylmuramate dehydrogenase [Bacilli bacterium]